MQLIKLKKQLINSVVDKKVKANALVFILNLDECVKFFFFLANYIVSLYNGKWLMLCLDDLAYNSKFVSEF